LMAPYSGAKARRKIVSGSKKIKKNLIDYVENSLDGIRTQFNDRIDSIAKRGKDTINHASEKVKM